MRDEYDFTNAEKNPYVRGGAKQPVTIRLDPAVLEYFRQLAQEVHQPYQTLINSYLSDCARERRRPTLVWK